ncbi:MAG: hypothetical protein HZB32_02540, partial [Nitrospirae bacterium]|nr:hypothetical protein [Nitrospirota bacterium]
MVEFAHHMGARVVNFFFMVCTGRGEKLTHITPEQYEEKLCGGCHARPHASHGDYLDE